jgi:TRAP-type C4-dicarboxylate transport system substrate-binding protein
LATVTLGLGAGRAAAEERRIATLAPTGSPWMNMLEKSALEIEEKTEGRVKIRYYSGGVQGDEKDVVRKIRLKQLDGGGMSIIGLSIIYPGIRVLQLPLFFANEEEVDYVRQKMWSHFQRKFADKGFFLQEPGDGGWNYIYSSRAITNIGELRKARMWAWVDDPVVREFFSQLQLSSVPLGVPDVLGALKTGRIDAAYGPPLIAIGLQWYNEITHTSMVPIAYAIGAGVIRHEVWEATSEADRATETEISYASARSINRRVKKDNERALKAMAKAGVKMVDAPPELAAKLQDAAEKSWHALAGKVFSQEELDMALEHRAAFRAKQQAKAKAAAP